MKFTNVNELINFIEHEKRISKKTDLRNMQKYCEIFNHPERTFPSIHITGTNGKGSVVAYLNEIFGNASLKVGCFTSPYITCFNERIRYQNENITDSELLSIGNLILEKYPEFLTQGLETPTFFEFITLICFIYFSKKDVDIVLLEVGMGGRLDATNVVTPLISVITGISTDHTEVLGRSEEAILTEKLGIVKNNIPLYANISQPNLQQMVLDYVKTTNSPIFLLNKNDLQVQKCDLTGSVFAYKAFKDLKITMLGYHQIENAILALEVASAYFRKKQDSRDYNVALYRGLAKTQWLGRLEIICKEPLIIVDGAHNVGGIERITEFISSLETYQPKRAIVAISDNKDKKHMIELLDQTFDELIFTEFHYMRSSSATNLFHLSTANNKLLFTSYDEIIQYIQNNPLPLTIFIGSLYFISDIRKIFNI